MTTQTEARRQTQWGHWGLTFFWGVPGAYAPTEIVGQLHFPVGNCGPMDVGGRDYRAIVTAWNQDGTLPEGLVTEAERLAATTKALALGKG